MNVQAIIAAGGLGTRLKQDLPKPLVKIHGKPILAYTLESFQKSSLIDSIVLVGHKKYLPEIKKIVEKYSFKKVKDIIVGGKTRCDSVYQGLMATLPITDIVVIHDAARPAISSMIIDQAILLAGKYKAVVVAVPVKSTIKKVDLKTLTIKETLNRNELWEIQTPQVFRREILFKAYKTFDSSRAKGAEVPTDDASLIELLGIKVKILHGDYQNIKVTTPEDLNTIKNFLIKDAR